MLVVLSLQLNAQTKNFLDKPYFATTTTVDTLVVPDEIYLQIILTEKDSRGKVSVEELEKKMVNTLTSLDIDLAKQLYVKDYTSNIRKYFILKDNIQKSKFFNLKLFDARALSKVYVALEQVGISNIAIEKVEYSKLESLKAEMLILAVEKANQKANLIVGALGQKLGKAIFIEEIERPNEELNQDYEWDKFRVEYSEPIVQSKELSLEFEKIYVSKSIKINFELL